MAEMIERVARAIFAAKSQTHTTWEQCDWGYRTMKMKEAFRVTIAGYWRAMIDAALK